MDPDYPARLRITERALAAPRWQAPLSPGQAYGQQQQLPAGWQRQPQQQPGGGPKVHLWPSRMARLQAQAAAQPQQQKGAPAKGSQRHRLSCSKAVQSLSMRTSPQGAGGAHPSVLPPAPVINDDFPPSMPGTTEEASLGRHDQAEMFIQ